MTYLEIVAPVGSDSPIFMNTGSKTDRILVLLLGLFFALSAPYTWAAKAPLASKKLEKEASHIVSGKIVEAT